MASAPIPDRDGYRIVVQGTTRYGGAISFAVFRRSDGVGLGAYFDDNPGGDMDQAIERDRLFLASLKSPV